MAFIRENKPLFAAVVHPDPDGAWFEHRAAPVVGWADDPGMPGALLPVLDAGGRTRPFPGPGVLVYGRSPAEALKLAAAYVVHIDEGGFE